MLIAWTALTGRVGLEEFLGFVPHGLAIFLQSEVAGLLPGRGADLEEVSPLQEELQVHIALHPCENSGAERTDPTD